MFVLDNNGIVKMFVGGMDRGLNLFGGVVIDWGFFKSIPKRQLPKNDISNNEFSLRQTNKNGL